MWHRVKKTRTEKTNRFDSRFHRKKYLHTWTKKCWWWTNSKSLINLVSCFCYAMHLKTATKKINRKLHICVWFWTEKPNTEAHSFNFIPIRFECVYAYKSVCLCVRSLSVKIFQFVFHAQNTHTHSSVVERDKQDSVYPHLSIRHSDNTRSHRWNTIAKQHSKQPGLRAYMLRHLCICLARTLSVPCTILSLLLIVNKLREDFPLFTPHLPLACFALFFARWL